MNIRQVMARAPVIAVLVIEDLAQAVPLARALVRGGIPVLEVTLRTPVALEAIARITGEVEGAIVGAGTVTNVTQLRELRQRGAAFAVSPGFSRLLADAALSMDVPWLPGVASSTEIIAALEHGFDALKFFPAEAAGGVAMLQAFAGPFPDLRFCPTGGITAEKALRYLSLPNVLCVGGSWLAEAAALAARDFARIEGLAREAASLLRR